MLTKASRGHCHEKYSLEETAVRPIILADIATASPGEAPDSVRLLAEPTEIRHVLGGAKAPIHMFAYQLAADGMVVWDRPAQARTLYVRAGEVVIRESRFGAGSVIVIEGDAECTVRAGSDGADFIEFFDHRGPVTRRGGAVHAVPGGASPIVDRDGVRSSVYSDARCPGCGVWLHENHIRPPGRHVDLHSHTEDEVIVVMEGEMVAGARHLGPGSVLSVARDTLYKFDAGEGGLRFINYRPSRPRYLRHGESEPIDEMAIYDQMGLAPATHALV
jgi:hypothetical protein